MRALAVMAAGVALFAPHRLPGQDESGGAHRHLFSLFAGAAASSRRHETAVSIGPSYRYQLARYIAVGPVLQMTSYRSETSTVFLGSAFLTPYRGVALTIGPGVEWITTIADAVEPVVEHGVFTFRVGVGYEIRVRRGYSVSPEAAVNLGSGAPTGTYGLAFGISF